MNLIEQLGGYDSLKKEYEETLPLIQKGYKSKSMEIIRLLLLEYRRQHNIFEAGDKVVFREFSGIGGASDAIDLMTAKSIDAFGVRMTNSLCPWAIQIRHATDAEIKAGRRL